MNPQLIDVYKRLTETPALDGSHVSIDRDMHGEECLNISPNWIEGAALSFILAVARDAELEVALSRDGLRIAPHTSPTSLAVRDVKRAIAGEGDEE